MRARGKSKLIDHIVRTRMKMLSVLQLDTGYAPLFQGYCLLRPRLSLSQNIFTTSN